MADIRNPQLEKVYGADSAEEIEDAYDEWSANYEDDVLALGFRLPAVASAVFARFVAFDCGPILDAGCGTGLQSEPLALAGYRPITGIDLSRGMLAVARRKGIYAALRQCELGAQLPFENDAFAHTITVGAITAGHAPPDSFDELIRVTRVDGLIVFGLRVDEAMDAAYPSAVRHFESEGRWRREYETDAFATMPTGEPDMLTRVFVYRVTN